MPLYDLPFSIEIPASLGNNRLSFLVSENIHAIQRECISVPHNHGNYELRYIASGTGNQIIEETEFKTSAGDVLLLHPNEYHYQTEDAISSDLAQYSFCFLIKPPLKSATAAEKKGYMELNELFQSIRLLKDETFSLRPSFQRLANEIHQKQYGYFNYLQSICITLLVDLIRLSGQVRANLFPPEELKYAGYWREQINRFLRYHYMDDVKLRDLANTIRVSERQASRLVIREFGVNYITKLIETRIQQAKFKLCYSNQELHEISFSCGFQNYSYFTTCFRKITGMTPTEYRKKYQQEQV